MSCELKKVNRKICFSLAAAFTLLLTVSIFIIPLNSITTTRHNNGESFAQSLTFSTTGVINDVTTSGSYNFTIQEAGLYKFRVVITGNITVRVKLYFEENVFSNYFEKYVSKYEQIDSANDISPDMPYEVILWIEHPGSGFFFITREDGNSGTFSATVTSIKKGS